MTKSINVTINHAANDTVAFNDHEGSLIMVGLIQSMDIEKFVNMIMPIHEAFSVEINTQNSELKAIVIDSIKKSGFEVNEVKPTDKVKIAVDIEDAKRLAATTFSVSENNELVAAFTRDGVLTSTLINTLETAEEANAAKEEYEELARIFNQPEISE